MMDAGDCLKKSFGEALKRARIEKGLSQQQLAEQLSVDRSSIANWETCRRLPDFYTITKLSALLQFDAAALLPVPQQEKKPLVMMLDDEKIILNGGVPILQKLLPKAEIVCFTKPSAALEYARSFKIDLALLDIEMGMVSGLGVCRELLTYHPRTKEIARQNARILVLQMGPHVICNTMTSIYYLCASNPSKAQQVTLDFTTYLRKNFSAIANEGLIPFREELVHTKAYLAVEQVRFEDKLFVSFDVPHTLFKLPPLTLQPIVENAVKHGVDPELDPLYISVTTKAAENGSEIIVEDTGMGFGSSDKGGQHIALKNISERLKMMCNGTLTISPRENGGTVVCVFIPQK